MIQRQADTYLPTKFSSTELLPALWPPTTAICGRSSCICTPSCVNASCSLFTIGINCSIPVLPDILSSESRNLRYTARITRTHVHTQHTYTQHTHTHTHFFSLSLSLLHSCDSDVLTAHHLESCCSATARTHDLPKRVVDRSELNSTLRELSVH